MNETRKRNARARHALLALVLCAVAVWIWKSRSGGDAGAGGELARGADAPEASGRSAAHPERPTLSGQPGPDAGASDQAADEVTDVPEGHIAVREVSLDELREAQGLPPVTGDLAAIEDFRAPTEREHDDPLFRKLYEADRQLHQLEVLAEHERSESRRFARDAAAETDARRRRILSRSAEFHERWAATYRQRASEARKARAAIATEIYASGASRAQASNTKPAGRAGSGDVR